ncbi:MAG: sulfatase, partial [Gemmatimonadota bacterium]
DYMQGDAFLGPQKTSDPEYTFMSRLRMDERYDLVRAVRDKRYRYIRNYMPFRITMQHVDYLFNAPSAQSWEDAFRAGTTNEVQSRFFRTKPVEELYDTENDYWEVNNLADDPAYADVLERMRNALTDWQREIRDVGLIPETEYVGLAGNQSMYDYMRSPECPFDELLRAANLATSGGPEALGTFIDYLNHDHSAVRYWGATGILILKDAAGPAVPALKKAADDESGAVATLVAEALYGLGEKEAAVEAYANLLQNTTDYTMTDRNFALNSIDAINDKSPEIVAVVRRLYDERSGSVEGFARYSVYDFLMSEYLLKKWERLAKENQ